MMCCHGTPAQSLLQANAMMHETRIHLGKPIGYSYFSMQAVEFAFSGAVAVAFCRGPPHTAKALQLQFQY